MSKLDRATAIFNDGFVCSQAILATYGADLGLDTDTALRLAAGFGGGMSWTGKTCGAVTGALMVIGLSSGHVSPDDKASKKETYTMVQNFMRRFEHIHGTVNCTELLGHDLGKPEEYKQAIDSNLIKTLCPNFVASAARLLEEMLQNQGVPR